MLLVGTTWGWPGKQKGEYDKAIEYYEKALKSGIKTFGEDHPQVAIYRNNLGLAWQAKGEYDKAIEYYEKALSVLSVKLGNEHPDTKLIETNLSLAKRKARVEIEPLLISVVRLGFCAFKLLPQSCHSRILLAGI